MSDAQTHRLIVANPRGFCAGVVRAIDVVERLLGSQGAPLYVRKQIVHNRAVVQDFQERGVVFVEELDQVPEGETVVFSAHGVSPQVRREAERRGLRAIDATCPLVTKVHQEVVRHTGAGLPVVLIGHPGHDEVLGTLGEAPGAIILISCLEDVAGLDFPSTAQVAYATQTTLSVDETREIVDALRERFPRLVSPCSSDICYATQNRQDAVKTLVSRGIEHLLVVGSVASSNSRRLGELAENLGVPADLIDGGADIDPGRLAGRAVIGLTAGASAPEHLVQEVVSVLAEHGWRAEELIAEKEDIHFKLPKGLDSFGF